MKHERNVYLLDPRLLSPETIAVTFAKTSRSPESFRAIASELSEQTSAAFNEKWVVGYGHSSVAEHAVLHIAVENISRLAVETLESNRLASYTEKSTRYQTWEDDAFHIPSELEDHPLQQEYIQTVKLLLKTYKNCLPRVLDWLEKTSPQTAGESTASRDRRLRSNAIDVCRFLLPAASLANVGVTINARALEHAVGKMMIHPLIETRTVGLEIRKAAQACVPTLMKYANEIPYLQDVCNSFGKISTPSYTAETDWCKLVEFDQDTIERLLAASLYREKNFGYAQAMSWVEEASGSEKQELLGCLLGELDRHTIPARELENASFTFDLLMDQGAYFEVKRHRMMTQTPQRLTALHGYAVPRALVEAGVMPQYEKAMRQAQETYFSLAQSNPDLAAYVVPNGFNRRVLINLNLRSAIHFIKLRSASNAHFSVRRVAQQMAQEISLVLPDLANYLGRNPDEDADSINAAFFERTF